MKTKIIIRSFVILLLSSSCSDHELLAEREETSTVTTRGVVYDEFGSVTNPNLITDWENINTITLNTVAHVPITVSSPWNNEGTSGLLSRDFRMDIKKENGWTMLFHTLKNIGNEPGLNYICFYNQFTGIVKIFYYEETVSAIGSNSLWGVEAERTSTLFNLLEYLAVPNDQKKLTYARFTNEGDRFTNGIRAGWNGFEFEVPYSTDYQGLDLKVSAYDTHVMKFDFLGKTNLTTEGTILSTSNTPKGIGKLLATFTKLGASSLIKQISSSAKFLGFGVKDELNKIVSGGDYMSIMSKGLNFIFGTSTVTTEQKVKLTTSGTIELEGDGEWVECGTAKSFTINLFDIMNRNLDKLRQSSLADKLVLAPQSSSPKYLGVWTVESAPTVSFERYIRINYGSKNVFNSTMQTVVFYDVAFPYPQPTVDYKVIVNPYLEQYIKEQNISVELVLCDSLNNTVYLAEHQEIPGCRMAISTIYKDDNMQLSKYNFDLNQQFTEYVYRGNMPGGSLVWFWDYGDILEDRMLAVIKVSTTFEMNDKTKTVVQSRIYPTKGVIKTRPEVVPCINHHYFE